MKVFQARREGRSHRNADIPCQDSFSSRVVPARGIVFAVADGLGSRPLSHEGSRVAAEAAVARLTNENKWGIRSILRAMRSARRAIRIRASELGVSPHDLATTLQIGVLDADGARVAQVGDGGFVAGTAKPVVALAPAGAGYANEVAPITGRWWRLHVEYAEVPGASWLMGFSDGLTRLLMQRGGAGWTPYSPFFDRILAGLGEAPADLAERILAAPNVDASWDDDKCLVVAVSV